MDKDFVLKKPRDLTKINVADMGELLWWSLNLGTTPEKIVSLVARNGNVAATVRKLLEVV